MAYYSTQSTSKRQKLSFKEEETIGVNRISNLPNCLPTDILSFIPSEQAIQTGILSNKWRPLWTYVPKLDLDIERFHASLPSGVNSNWDLCSIIFTHIVSRILDLHKLPCLRAFHLKYFDYYDPIILDKWVSTITTLNLEELDLKISGKEYWEYPLTIFSWKTLVVLKLGEEINLNLPLSSSFEFQSLKTLHLEMTRYTSYNSFTVG